MKDFDIQIEKMIGASWRWTHNSNDTFEGWWCLRKEIEGILTAHIHLVKDDDYLENHEQLFVLWETALQRGHGA